MKKSKKPSRQRGLFARYRRLPAALRSRRAAERRDARRLLLTTLCVLVMLACAAYILSWELTRLKIERDNAAYSALYPLASATEPAPGNPSASEAGPMSAQNETDSTGAEASTKPISAQSEADISGQKASTASIGDATGAAAASSDGAENSPESSGHAADSSVKPAPGNPSASEAEPISAQNEADISGQKASTASIGDTTGAAAESFDNMEKSTKSSDNVEASPEPFAPAADPSPNPASVNPSASTAEPISAQNDADISDAEPLRGDGASALQSPAASGPSNLHGASPTDSPSAPTVPSPTPSPAFTAPVFEIAQDATRAPLATPDAETYVYALETPPPTQSSFADLLATNPDTVGFLRIGDVLSLPVVQRQNDNEYYLNHSFSLEESIAGTLFLDGANRLVPEDACLIVYGHNMRNGTMFHHLCDYDALDFLKENALVRFDTIYQNRAYVPFAVLTVTADPDSARHVDIRKFAFDGAEFEDYVDALRDRSIWNIPVDVAWGDSVLLLVTCEYTHDNGRFVVALRALRDGEGEDEMRALVQATKAR